MGAIYKREIKACFSSMIGYVVIAYMLFIVGVGFWYVNLSCQDASIGNTLNSISFWYTLAIPLLTMRLLAEEQKQKTDQLLFSSPVTVTDVILGKYLAVVSIYTIPILGICTMPLVLSRYGTVSFVQSYTSILAYWMLGCVLLAIGLLISAMTDSQIIAAILSFAVVIVLSLMPTVASVVPSTALASLVGITVLIFLLACFFYIFVKNIIVSGAIFVIGEAVLVTIYAMKGEMMDTALSTVVSSVSFYTRFSNFLSGTFSISSVVYYVSFAALFLYLATQVVQKRRWS